MNRRSAAVKLALVPLLASAFTGCGGDDEETAYCVDENDVVVENRFCEDDRVSGGFFLFYGGIGGARLGSRVPAGGDRVRASNKAEIARRGGFGGSSRPGGVGRSVSGSGSGGGFSGGG
ncbi:MAG: hypothetical protein AVDCRST_MAG30-4577 [uncultured Solirubrobacteraceae bacterium]|uniref:Uncharacterized protein n=1 Tax=uncultured Solirubrobacteraceae bacterium TaxID=1162706 RepID=A0A6J4U569_9ACTN|nr:MAG: hypothetical protein AVDCRST_MAG30-4577 [uncultured Solirubrobacteraceae bacterium]